MTDLGVDPDPCRSSICRCGFGGIVVGTITIYGLMKSIVRTLTTLALLREGPGRSFHQIHLKFSRPFLMFDNVEVSLVIPK